MHDFFIGMLTKSGNKNSASKILQTALQETGRITGLTSFDILTRIYVKLEMFVELKKIKKMRQISYVPVPVRSKRRVYLVVKALIDSVREDKRKINFALKLKDEMTNLLTKNSSRSSAYKKQLLEQSLQNRSNIHFRWR